MIRHAIKNALVCLCLLLQLIASTSSAGGLVLCMDGDGSVTIETQLAQLACCGELANPGERDYREPGLVEEDACVDASLTLPVSLRAASSRADDGAYTTASVATTIAAPLVAPSPAQLQLYLPPQVLLPDRTLKALSTVRLLV